MTGNQAKTAKHKKLFNSVYTLIPYCSLWKYPNSGGSEQKIRLLK